MGTQSKLAPWKDYQGNDLYEGDKLKHPSGQTGVIEYHKDRHNQHDRWLVNYGDRILSRLCLQINERGQGVKC